MGMTLLEIMIVLAILAIVMGFLVGPRVMDAWRRSKEDTTRLIVSKLANEAYSEWALATGKSCPSSLAELRAHTDKKGTKDGWGNELLMFCGDDAPEGSRGGLAILSKGSDGKQGTEDDIKSWE
jgi:prepilin-type N-terminal cleavage/methylation domain-containing protein